MTDELALPNQELGKALVSEARQQYEEQCREAVVREVSRMMQLSDQSKAQEEFHRKAQDWYRRKLAAIEAGEFDFDRAKAQLVMRDANLYRANY